VKSIDEWEELVAKRLVAIEPEDIGPLAELCAENPAWGAWHAASIYYGTQCPCPACEEQTAPPW
jgi:hypothetical protein